MRIRRAVAALIVAAAVVEARSAAADDEDPRDEAKRLYAEGHDAFIAGRCAEAMPLLVRASKLVPSPNSDLLIARCLAGAGKPVEASARYAAAERDALDRVRSGETRYAETAAAAAKEGSALRARLGTLRVRLAPRAGVGLEIDGAPTEIGATGDTRLLREPGPARVTFVLPAGRREHVVSVIAARESVVTYATEASPAPAPPGLPWTFYASTGVAVVGGATFAGLGLASESTYRDLESTCGDGCGEAQRREADQGRTYQALANVGLAVGLVAAAFAAIALFRR